MTRVGSAIANAAGLIVLSAISLIGVEAGYRVYLARSLPAELVQPALDTSRAPDFTIHSYPPASAYNRTHGFDFRSGSLLAGVQAGKLTGCEPVQPINANGNLGARQKQLASGTRVLLVGSSYTMTSSARGELATDVAEDIINRDRPDHVTIENFSRDSYGMLQMIDMAAELARRYRPNLILIAFNSSDLARPRIWRNIIPVGDGFYRLYHSFNSTPENVDPSTTVLAVDQLITDRSTPEWCARIADAARAKDSDKLANDPLLSAAIKQFNANRQEARAPKVAVDFWRTDVSFALNMALHGTPYYDMEIVAHEAAWNSIRLNDYTQDHDFVASLKALTDEHIPVAFVHVPGYPELAKGEEWLFEPFGVTQAQGVSLVASLERATQSKVATLIPYLRTAIADPESYPISAHGANRNWHPSAAGTSVLGAAIADLLVRQYSRALSAPAVPAGKQ